MGAIRAEEGEYKGYPIIKIYTGKVYAVKDDEECVVLGVRKAAAVDDCIDAIRVFVDKHRKAQKEVPF